MLNIHFYKYQGTGNDFILIDNREEVFPIDDTALVARLCDRRFGIGADGLILLEKPVTRDAIDFRMRYYNADGGESSMCGNGGRCIVAFAQHLKIIHDTTRFRAIDGVHEARIETSEATDGSHASPIVSLRMTDVTRITMDGMDYVLDTGSPHFVRMAYDAFTVDVAREGQAIRNSAEYAAAGINVNFVSTVAGGGIRVATFERGVEAETLSCGTGVTAAAIAAFLQTKLAAKSLTDVGNVTDPHTTTVHTKGGTLSVRFEMAANGSFENVWLRGAAVQVFEGFV